MQLHRVVFSSLGLAAVVACSDNGVAPLASATQPGTGAPASWTVSRDQSGGGNAGNLHAFGTYHAFVPADFNGGIFGGYVDNNVTFEASREPNGKVHGHFYYRQDFAGTVNEYTGEVTCLAVYDTPVLVGFPSIPAHTQNRAKWGGLVKSSTDPTEPAGSYLWFQSIDNDANGGHSRGEGEESHGQPDLTTLSGFGDSTATEAFCAIPKVPNPSFGPFAVDHGRIEVQ